MVPIGILHEENGQFLLSKLWVFNIPSGGSLVTIKRDSPTKKSQSLPLDIFICVGVIPPWKGAAWKQKSNWDCHLSSAIGEKYTAGATPGAQKSSWGLFRVSFVCLLVFLLTVDGGTPPFFWRLELVETNPGFETSMKSVDKTSDSWKKYAPRVFSSDPTEVNREGWI